MLESFPKTELKGPTLPWLGKEWQGMCSFFERYIPAQTEALWALGSFQPTEKGRQITTITFLWHFMVYQSTFY
jgi:hypothetical protein